MRRSITRARLVWGRLGTLILREGAETRVAEMFYRAVVHMILLYRLGTWVLLSSMEKKVKGIHTGFLQKITGKRAQRLGERTWKTPGAEGAREADGIQLEMTYIGRRKETVAQWVALRPLFEVCEGENGYK